ncbi:MAG: hypothetical protein NVV70_16860 [Cellulomonas sp.]|nr:hypothetical protein [Cellulomonas sp.]MCR6649717.1 hypothetical protein [Cellulomonas sp.]
MSKRLRYMTEPITPDPTTQPGAGLTQDQVNQIVQQRIAEATRRAEEKAQADLAAKLGGASLDDVLAAHKTAQANADALKSEAQRDREAAAREKAEAEQLKTDAAAELHITRITAALVAAGAPEKAATAITVPGVKVGATPEEIKTAVAALKTDLPGLFTAPAVPGSDPGKGPAGRQVLSSEGAEGLAEYERRFGKKS